jgi:hypothetical protein
MRKWQNEPDGASSPGVSGEIPNEPRRSGFFNSLIFKYNAQTRFTGALRRRYVLRSLMTGMVKGRIGDRWRRRRLLVALDLGWADD